MTGEREQASRHQRAAAYDRAWRDVYGDMQEIGPVHRHMRRLVRQLLAGLDYGSVLDVGCGAGHNLTLLRRSDRAQTVDGADISPEALRRARARGMNNVFELDVEHEALVGRWDLVFSSLVLEHMFDDVAALEHMVAMTRRHLVLTTMAGNYDRYRRWEHQVGHVRNYRRRELEGKLEHAGARVRRAIYWGYPWYSPLTRMLQNRWRLQPTFSPTARAAARMLYALYRLNSSRRGDLLIVHATVDVPGER